MTRIYLLRHGATASNRVKPYRIQGSGHDPELDEIGVAQAERAAMALMYIDLAAVYASPLLRARQTAMRLAQTRGLEVSLIPELIEANVGDWEGLTWDQVRDLHPDLFEQFMADPGAVPYLNGESFLDVQRRCVPALRALADRHPDHRIAVVGHNVVNRTILADLIGLPIAKARSLAQSNGGVNVIEYHDGQAKLIAMNANLHLEGLPA